jgi:4-hydroxyphenylpyruvate dioxygenase
MIRALNHATVRSVGPQVCAEAAAAAGYDGVGLWAMDLPAGERDLAALRERLPLPVVEIDVAAWFARPAEADAARSALRDAAAKAAALGAPVVVTAAPSERVDGAADEALHRVAEDVAAHGVTLALEPLCQAAELSTPARVAAMLERVGHPRTTIAFDSFHAAVAGASPEEVAAVAEHIAIAHVADAPDLPRERLLEPHKHRVPPGDGVQPVAEYLDALAGAGYDGALSVDVFNEELWSRDAVEVAGSSLAALDRVLRAHVGGR